MLGGGLQQDRTCALAHSGPSAPWPQMNAKSAANHGYSHASGMRITSLRTMPPVAVAALPALARRAVDRDRLVTSGDAVSVDLFAPRSPARARCRTKCSSMVSRPRRRRHRMRRFGLALGQCGVCAVNGVISAGAKRTVTVSVSSGASVAWTWTSILVPPACSPAPPGWLRRHTKRPKSCCSPSPKRSWIRTAVRCSFRSRRTTGQEPRRLTR